jgi:hypothetical protein
VCRDDGRWPPRRGRRAATAVTVTEVVAERTGRRATASPRPATVTAVRPSLRTRAVRRAAPLLAAAALLAACGDDPDEPRARDGQEAGAVGADPTTVPEAIDADHTQAVLDELLPLLDEAERAAVAAAPTPELPDATREVFEAVHTPAVADPLLTSLEVAVSSEGSAEIRAAELEEQGATRWVVTELGEPSEECVPFRFDREHARQDSDQSGIGVLVRADDDRDPAGRNPTPWAIGLTGVEGQLDEGLDTICQTSEGNDEVVEG